MVDPIIRRPMVVGVGMVAIVLAATLAWTSVNHSSDGDESVAEVVAPVEPVVVPVASVSEPFTIEYRQARLGSELTGRDGTIAKAAVLEERTFRLEYQSAQQWELAYLDGSGIRDVFDNGTFRSWKGDELLTEEHLEDVALPTRFTMPLAVDAFHDHVDERGFERIERSSERGRAREVYERTIPQPHGEYYRSLPWRETDNVERVVMEFDENSSRILSYAEFMNGRATFEYEILSVG